MSSDNTCLPTNLQSKFRKYFSQHIDLAGSEAENMQFPEPELAIFQLLLFSELAPNTDSTLQLLLSTP